MIYLLSADFFKINLLKEILQEHYQSVKQLESRSQLTFWVQTVCKDYQQMTKSTLACKDLKYTPFLTNKFSLSLYFGPLLSWG